MKYLLVATFVGILVKAANGRAKAESVEINTTAAMRDASGDPIYDCLEPHITNFNGVFYVRFKRFLSCFGALKRVRPSVYQLPWGSPRSLSLAPGFK